MPIINRITRLFRADLHAVLDNIEEPIQVLRQSVREMSEAIDHEQQRLVILQQQKSEQQRRATETEASLQRLPRELDVCFAAEQEDLARGLIRRRLETESLLAVLNSRVESSDGRIAALTDHLQENQAHLASIEQKLALFVASDSLAEQDGIAGGNREFVTYDPSIQIPDEDVEVALLAEKQRRARS